MTAFSARLPGRACGALAKCFLGIDSAEVTLARRGFTAPNDAARQHLETVGRSFLNGYHAVLLSRDIEELDHRLVEVESLYRGFAYEGAGMALALLDHLFPVGPSRWRRFLAGPAAAHCYMLHVGYGWAVARLPWLRRNVDRVLARHDPLLRWLIVDGYGFHEGYFYWRKYVEEQKRPARLGGYALRAFDQGLGRSLWFMSGTDPARLVELIAHFPESRLADLWSGVGLACAYAGIADADVLKEVSAAAGSHHGQLAQGAAFAAKARQLAGNQAEHTEAACLEFCGQDSRSAAQITDDELRDLVSDRADEPAFEVWRKRIGMRLRQESGLRLSVA